MNEFKYYCEKCEYKTNSNFLYKQHCRTKIHIIGMHGNNEPNKEVYKCDECEYESLNKNNYLTHKLNNHATKEERKTQFKYYCDKCDFGVFTESSYQKHITSLRHKRLNCH